MSLHSHSYIPDYLTHELEGYNEPVLIFDLIAARHKIRFLKSLEERYNCSFLYAAKACDEKEIISLLAEESIGFDISNQNELENISANIKTPLVNHFISATGPGISNIINLSDVNVMFANSTTQWENLIENKPTEMILGLRAAISPVRTYVPHTSESRFGVTVDELKRLKPNAIHIHQSGGKSSSIYKELLGFLQNLILDIGYTPEVINLGGGAYDFTPTDIDKVLKKFREEIPLDTKLIFEFGYYWFAECGYAIGQVIDRNNNLPSISLDLSMECHLKWSVPIPLNALEFNDHTTRSVIFYGSTCYEGDCLGVFNYPKNSQLSDIFPIGKKLLFQGVDIYSISWNHSFNGIKKAKVKYIKP